MARELEEMARELKKTEGPTCCKEFKLSWRCGALATGLAQEAAAALVEPTADWMLFSERPVIQLDRGRGETFPATQWLETARGRADDDPGR